MTIAEVISKVNSTKPNQFSDDQLTGFIDTLEQLVQAEIMQIPVAQRVGYTWANNQDIELLVKTPYDSCYLFYVSAMIDYHNQEFDSYNHNMVHFNTLFDDYKKSYVREATFVSPRIQNYW